MPRKKKTESQQPQAIQTPPSTPANAPANADADQTAESTDQGQQHANPYRATFTCSAKGFELGENRRFKQLVFTFKENPGPEVTRKLKDAGFVYRGAEKAWTISASAAARELAVDLARELKGEQLEQSR